MKFVFLLKKSTFSGASYSALVNSQEPFVAVINKTYSKLTYLKLEKHSPKNSVEESLYFGVPIDSEIKPFGKKSQDNLFSSVNYLPEAIFQPWKFSYENMTTIDFLKAAFFGIRLPKNQVETVSVNIKDGDIQGATSDKIYNIFKDPDIVNEQKSIEIVNATPVDGLGGRVGKVLKNVGANVISITSGKEERVSRIFSSYDSKTLKRISKLLNVVSLVTNTNQSSDIKIMIGLDFMDRAE